MSNKEFVLKALPAVTRHPVIYSETIMMVCAFTQALMGEDSGPPFPNSSWKKNFKHHLGGLYAGTQGLAQASVVMPIVMKGVEQLPKIIKAAK